MELKDYLPDGWECRVTQTGPEIFAPTRTAAETWIEQTVGELISSASNLKGIVQVGWKGCRRPYRFSPALASVGGEESNQVSTFTSALNNPSAPSNPGIQLPEVPELDIISEVLGFDGSSALLRMSDDDLGLLSNTRTEVSSGLRANDWMKVKDHSQWWPDDELRNYKRRLLSDGQVTD